MALHQPTSLHRAAEATRTAAIASRGAASKVIPLVRTAWRRLTPAGRRRLALEHGALHSQTRQPGLTDLDCTGVLEREVEGRIIPVHWYEAGPSRRQPVNSGTVGNSAETWEHTPTVVFVHGFTLAGESWFLQFKYLRRRYPQARLLTMDLRGHGQTGEVPSRLCTIDGAADDVLAVIAERAASGPLIIVGHSLGGQIALNLLRRAESGLRERIAGIVLIATSIDRLAAQGVPQMLTSPVADAVRDAIEASPDQVDKFRDAIAAFIAPSLAVAVFHRKTEFDIIEFHAAMIHETPLATLVGYLDDLQEHEEFAARERLYGLPGTVLVGAKDVVTPRGQADLILEGWQEGELVEVPKAGHMLPLETPGPVNEAIARLLDRAQAS